MRINLVQREATVHGIATPAFLQNHNYFFTHLAVYSDGLIEGTELLDLELFRNELDQGMVAAAIPDGASFMVHGLGAFRVEHGEWALDRDGLFQLVEKILDELNPERRNLHCCYGQTTRIVDGVSFSILGVSNTPTVPRRVGRAPYASETGETSAAFWKEGDDYFLVNLRTYKDGFVELGDFPDPRVLTPGELAAAVESGVLITAPPLGAKIVIHPLGTFTLAESLWTIEGEDLLPTLRDQVDGLNGSLTSVDRCQKALRTYLNDSTEEHRARLREAYESVPKHRRRFTGDMDVQDIDIRMILYGEQEIEKWSHRRMARELGGPLPAIAIPKPKP